MAKINRWYNSDHFIHLQRMPQLQGTNINKGNIKTARRIHQQVPAIAVIKGKAA
jgi:hypothetical protein